MRSLIIALLSIGTCWAELPERFTTMAGELSGHFWMSLSREERTTFLYGFQSGHLHAKPDTTSAVTASREACMAQFKEPGTKQKVDCIIKSTDAKTDEYKRWEKYDPLPGGTYGEIVEATDRFFAEPENRVMSITAAWMIAKWKQEGRPQAEVDSLMDSFRETYIRLPRKACADGFWISASRCETLGTILKPAPTQKPAQPQKQEPCPGPRCPFQE